MASFPSPEAGLAALTAALPSTRIRRPPRARVELRPVTLAEEVGGADATLLGRGKARRLRSDVQLLALSRRISAKLRMHRGESASASHSSAVTASGGAGGGADDTSGAGVIDEGLTRTERRLRAALATPQAREIVKAFARGSVGLPGAVVSDEARAVDAAAWGGRHLPRADPRDASEALMTMWAGVDRRARAAIQDVTRRSVGDGGMASPAGSLVEVLAALESLFRTFARTESVDGMDHLWAGLTSHSSDGGGSDDHGDGFSSDSLSGPLTRILRGPPRVVTIVLDRDRVPDPPIAMSPIKALTPISSLEAATPIAIIDTQRPHSVTRSSSSTTVAAAAAAAPAPPSRPIDPHRRFRSGAWQTHQRRARRSAAAAAASRPGSSAFASTSPDDVSSSLSAAAVAAAPSPSSSSSSSSGGAVVAVRALGLPIPDAFARLLARGVVQFLQMSAVSVGDGEGRCLVVHRTRAGAATARGVHGRAAADMCAESSSTIVGAAATLLEAVRMGVRSSAGGGSGSPSRGRPTLSSSWWWSEDVSSRHAGSTEAATLEAVTSADPDPTPDDGDDSGDQPPSDNDEDENEDDDDEEEDDDDDDDDAALNPWEGRREFVHVE